MNSIVLPLGDSYNCKQISNCITYVQLVIPFDYYVVVCLSSSNRIKTSLITSNFVKHSTKPTNNNTFDDDGGSNMVWRARRGVWRVVEVGGQFLGAQKMTGDGRRPDVVGLHETQPTSRTILACQFSARNTMEIRAELTGTPLYVNFKLA